MALADRLNALKPRGRIQRAVQLTKDQCRALNTEQKRQQRARDRQLVAPTQQFMAELARYDLPLVQLLMAEYALKPANAGAPGRMRLLFLEQFAATCHNLFDVDAIGLSKMKSIYPIIHLIHQNTSLKVAKTQAARIGARSLARVFFVAWTGTR